MTARAVVDVAAWLSDDTDAVGIRDRDGRFYVVDRETYRATRAAADPCAVPVPRAAIAVPFDPFDATDAARVDRARWQQ